MYNCSEEEKRLQKLLIPVNIVVCLLCLTAIISLLVAPLFKINFGKLISATYDLAKDEIGQEISDVNVDVSEEVTFAEEESGGSSGGVTNKDGFLNALSDIDMELNFTIVGLGKAAFAKENKFDALIDSFFGKDAYEKILVPALSAAVAGVVRSGTGIALNEANEILTDIGNVQNKDEFEAKTDEWLDKIEESAGEPMSDEDKAKIREEMIKAYDKTIEISNGEFDLEKFVCTAVSDSMGYETPVTSYEEIGKQLLGGDGVSSGLNEYADTISTALMALFFGFMFFVFVWFVLFLFAFCRLFAPNKRFMMWYVKLFGGIPALIFWLLPTLAKGALQKTLGASIAGIFGAFSSLAWISGLCYVLLWLVSICWAFPIKHKIRKLRKEEKEQEG